MEVVREVTLAEREASKLLRTGEHVDVERRSFRLERRYRPRQQFLLVASNSDYVGALNAASQKVMAGRGELDLSDSVPVSDEHFANAGEVILTRSIDYDLTTSTSDVVCNGERWAGKYYQRSGLSL